MKNYVQSDYALNKSAKGIIYRFADRIVEITQDDYLHENPDKTPANFAELKALSVADYYDTDRSDYRLTSASHQPISQKIKEGKRAL